MSLRTRTILGLAARLAATAVAVRRPRPRRPPLQCGQTITVSTKLTHDLSGCAGQRARGRRRRHHDRPNGHTIRGVNAPGSIGIADDGHTRRHASRAGRSPTSSSAACRCTRRPRSVVRNLRVVRIGAGGVEGEASAGVLIEARRA